MTKKPTLRLGRLLAALALAAAGPLAAQSLSPAAATTEPTALLTCSAGRVTTSMPSVQASQQYQPRYYAELFRYTSAGWQHVSWSRMWVTQTYSNDANPGSTWGYAGPRWYPYGVVNGAWATSLYFNVTPGYYYAIKNWTSDSNWQFDNWATAWASRSGVTYCRA
jgi:hypothetical protein